MLLARYLKVLKGNNDEKHNEFELVAKGDVTSLHFSIEYDFTLRLHKSYTLYIIFAFIFLYNDYDIRHTKLQIYLCLVSTFSRQDFFFLLVS